MEQECFLIPQRLDSEYRIAGMPGDEVLPAALCLIVWLLCGHELIGFCGAMVWFAGLRFCKNRYGNFFLVRMLFYYAPYGFTKRLFGTLPSSRCRVWWG